jgi:hypothetical protein
MTRRAGAALRAHLSSPFADLLGGLDSLMAGGPRALAILFAGVALGWWIYVPLHELLHAAGCVAAGGSVSRLEIDALYGGALWARIFPFVASGSRYAGRLSGFDTHGSDLAYLATDLGPFLLTLWPGVWLLRRAARAGRAWLFGLLVPVAFAPFVSLPGDAYEIGSLAAVNTFWSASADRPLLVGDDVALRFAELSRLTSGAPWGGFAFAAIAGLAWALATYALASLIANRLGERPLPPPAPRSPR